MAIQVHDDSERDVSTAESCSTSCCCTKCCCTMPHGKFVLFPTMSLSIASIFSLLTLINCHFLKGDGDLAETFGYSYSLNAGFWPGCVSAPYYGSNGLKLEEIGSAIRNDQVRLISVSFGIIASVVGTCAMILLWPITCKLYKTWWIEVIGITAAFACISQLVTLIMLRSKYCEMFGCKLDWGGILSIVAAAFWLVGAVGIWIIPVKRCNNEHDVPETLQGAKTEAWQKVSKSKHGTDTVEATTNEPNDVEVGIKSALQDEECSEQA